MQSITQPRVRRRAAALVCSIWLFAGAAAAQSPLGPAPRGDDGRFRNFVHPLERAGARVTLPFFVRRIGAAWRKPVGVPPRVENDGTALHPVAIGDAPPRVTWINHATLLVQMQGRAFLTDPIWSRTAGPTSFTGARRVAAPGLALEHLPPIDFVLISHNHYDHLDLPSLRKLVERNPDLILVAPLGNRRLLARSGARTILELDWGERRTIAELEVHCLPAQHWSQRGLFDARRALWSSWAVFSATRSFYFAGDTGYMESFRTLGAQLGPFDLAAVPVGAYEPQAMMRAVHLDPEQAVQTGLDLRARRTLAIHYGTFDLADEPLAEPPARFRQAAEAVGLSEDQAWVFALGESREF
ncbi:MAG: MBL fold metallo-hydrolase [Proteobacteria bacterium]|nr:MBL fold metallo-hydrolase [Pseudomonadota bacterium]